MQAVAASIVRLRKRHFNGQIYLLGVFSSRLATAIFSKSSGEQGHLTPVIMFAPRRTGGGGSPFYNISGCAAHITCAATLMCCSHCPICRRRVGPTDRR